MDKITPFHYFDGNFSMSDIKIFYVPQKGQVTANVCAYEASFAEPSNEAKKYIDEKWKKESDKELDKTGSPLKDEKLLSVASIDLNNGRLEVVPTSYKRWKTTAKKEFYQKFPNVDIPVPLNVQMLVETLDKQLVLGPRPGKDTLQLPGGMVNVSDFKKEIRQNDNLVSAAHREFSEEIANIAGTPILNTSFMGTAFYAGRVLTTVFYTGQIEKSADDLNEYRNEHASEISGFKEFPKLECIGATKGELETALYTQKLQETAFIGLLLYGNMKFGTKWLEKHCPKQMIADHLRQKIR